jgi:hypothetical protein
MKIKKMLILKIYKPFNSKKEHSILPREIKTAPEIRGC